MSLHRLTAPAFALGLAAALTAAPPARAEVAEVRASRAINASADALYAYLLDLSHHPQVWPEGCTADWELGAVQAGPGASAELTYRVGGWRRRLPVQVGPVQPGARIELLHPGKKGFTTIWTLQPGDGVTKVSVDTWVGAPPKPFKGFYEKRVRPGWTECHVGLLDNLAREMARVAPR
jgi:hypothetical protein